MCVCLSIYNFSIQNTAVFAFIKPETVNQNSIIITLINDKLVPLETGGGGVYTNMSTIVPRKM